MVDFAAIGHVVIDTIIKDDGEWTNTWGPIGCITLVAKKLGKSVKAVTKVGEDISDENITQLKELGINLNGMIIKGVKTTRIINDLRGKERRGKLVDFCEVIKPVDVVDLPDAVVIDPVVWEVPRETLTSISGEIIAVDAQGFVRDQRRAKNGLNLLKRWSNEGLLKRFQIFKSTEEELWDFTAERDTLRSLEKIASAGSKIAIATVGENGALLVMGNKRFRVPVYKIEKKDDMGAGDSFLSGFFCEYLDGKDPLWCAAMGSAAASSILETVGPKIDASIREIRERAENVHNRIIKI